MNSIRINYNSREYLVSTEKENLLDVIKEAGIPIGAPCGGKGSCKKCRVEVSVPENDASEEALACQFKVSGDISVDVPSPSEARILTEAYWPDIRIKWDKTDDQLYGVAVDIGTTTVVVYLEDLKENKNIGIRSFLNPQSAYGADVVSRMQKVLQDAGSLEEQSGLIRSSINNAIKKLAEEKGIPGDHVERICIAGNNPMLHFLKGVDPSGMAVFPFNPDFTDEQLGRGGDVGMDFCPDAELVLLPSLSSYVGADILAGMAATELFDEEAYSIYIDIGTNGEMALGNKKKIVSCATAAGPAFEGARISCGLGGVDGAVHSFGNSGFETIGSKKPLGLCGSGLVDVIAWMLDSGKLDASGYLENPVEIIGSENTFVGKPMNLTPQDIREVQLAKGAIAAGIQTMITEAGIEESQVERLYLAGGFGYALHVDTASRIGLFPDSLKDKVIRAGNLAGLGARLALHSKEFRNRIKAIQDMAEYFDLSTHMGFNEAFVMEMQYPQSR